MSNLERFTPTNQVAESTGPPRQTAADTRHSVSLSYVSGPLYTATAELAAELAPIPPVTTGPQIMDVGEHPKLRRRKGSDVVRFAANLWLIGERAAARIVYSTPTVKVDAQKWGQKASYKPTQQWTAEHGETIELDFSQARTLRRQFPAAPPPGPADAGAPPAATTTAPRTSKTRLETDLAFLALPAEVRSLIDRSTSFPDATNVTANALGGPDGEEIRYFRADHRSICAVTATRTPHSGWNVHLFAAPRVASRTGLGSGRPAPKAIS